MRKQAHGYEHFRSCRYFLYHPCFPSTRSFATSNGNFTPRIRNSLTSFSGSTHASNGERQTYHPAAKNPIGQARNQRTSNHMITQRGFMIICGCNKQKCKFGKTNLRVNLIRVVSLFKVYNRVYVFQCSLFKYLDKSLWNTVVLVCAVSVFLNQFNKENLFILTRFRTKFTNYSNLMLNARQRLSFEKR